MPQPVWLVLVLMLVSLARPGVVRAAEPAVRVEATATLGLPEADRASFDAALAEAARKGAEEAGVAGRADAPARLVVEVAWADERSIDYVGRIRVEPEHAGAEPLALRGFGCEMCGTEELLDRVRSEVALALGPVTWPAPELAPAEPTAAPLPEAADEPPAPRRGHRSGNRSAPRLGALGWSGVGVASLGLTSVVAGAVLWAREDRLELRPDDAEGPVWVRSSRVPGIGLVAAGASAMVIGVALLVVDRVQARRHPLAVQPVLGRGLAGLAVGGRF